MTKAVPETQPRRPGSGNAEPSGASRDLAHNIPWDRVARYYDAYVTVDFDVPYFVGRALEVGGPVLELMCGTGRISVPVAETGVGYCGVDLSPAFTAVLSAKLAGRGLRARVVTMDARAFDLGQRFALIFIGFNAFSELLGEADQRYVERDADGSVVEDFILPIRFDLIELDRFTALAETSGLRVDRVFGDYDEGPYDPAHSRFIIVELTAADG